MGQVIKDSPMGEPRFKARGVDKHFGPVQALTQVDLDLYAGQVTALCGDNGAGKSVLTKCIAGIYEIDHGQFFWEGNPVHIRAPRDAARLGIETVYQDLALPDNLNGVCEVADRIAVVPLGRMVTQGRATDFDRQTVVDYMTTGASSRAGQQVSSEVPK